MIDAGDAARAGSVAATAPGLPTTPWQTFRRHLPTYRQLVSISTQIVLTYRVNVLLFFVSILTQVYLLKVVWTAIYAGRGVVDEVELATLISYLTIATLQTSFMFPEVAYLIENKVRKGDIAIDLGRPVPFLGQILASQVGFNVGWTLFLVLALPLAALVGGIQPPASVTAALLYLVSLLLAYVIMVLIGVLLGLIAFWTIQVWGFEMIYSLVNRFFAGALMPLWFFPPPLRAIADLLPFQTQVFIPLALYFGRLTGPEIARAFGTQIFWIVVLAIVARFAWRRAIRRVVVQGG